MTAADRNRRRKAKIRRAKNRMNRTARGTARAQRRAKSARVAARRATVTPEPVPAPDATCVTLPDGDCVATEPCMHSEPAPC